MNAPYAKPQEWHDARRLGIGGSGKARFLAYVRHDEITGCWIWGGPKGPGEYGSFQHNKFRTTAHRFSHILFKGPVNSRQVVDHLCRNPICVNPDHLEAVTQAENVKRGNAGAHQRMKTSCPKGHPYDSANTRIQKQGRTCIICSKQRKKAYENNNRQKINARRRASYMAMKEGQK